MQLRGPGQVSLAFGLGLVRLGLLHLLFDGPMRLMTSFSCCQRAFRPPLRSFQVRQALLDLGQPFLGRRVLLLFQGLPFDLLLGDLALDFVDLRGQAVDLHAQFGLAASSIRSIALSGRNRSVI